jgi:serine/threonine protein kinase/formylglycine-generating enzyme required for sulfatase activity
MPPTLFEQSLLHAALARQLGLLPLPAVIEALQVCQQDSARTVREILLQRNLMSNALASALEVLAREHLERHAGNVEAALAAVPAFTELCPHLESLLGSPKPDQANAPQPGPSPPLGQPTLNLHSPQQPATPALPLPPGERSDLATRVEGNTHRQPPRGAAFSSGEPARATPSPAATTARAAAPFRFRTLRLLGRGGLGEVFIAQDEELQREVALKEIQSHHLGDTESRERFLLEAEITGHLEHPGIVPVYGLGTYADGRPFYAMRFIKGESLQQALARYHAGTERPPRERTLELRQLLMRFAALCNAIAYAHSRGVLHRDLKPANVMLGEFGETLVVDWGLAKRLGRSEAGANTATVPASDSRFTQLGQVMGTPAFMSPEQAAGRHDALGPPADVYSLGATLYALLTGQAPFTKSEVPVILRNVQEGRFPRPRTVLPSIPMALEAIVLKAMTLIPEERYATARELAADVERWLADEPTTAYPEPWRQQLNRWLRRHQTTVAVVGALLLTTTLGLAISTLLIGREQQRTAQALQNEADARHQEEQARWDRALTQVEQLRTADAGAVPQLLDDLKPYHDEILPRLQQLWREPDSSERQRLLRMRVGLALLASQPESVTEELFAWMLATDDPRELELTRDVLAVHGSALAERLWTVIEDKATRPAVRFRALVGLARFDPDDPRWSTAAPATLEPWLRADPIYFGVLTRALRSARRHLLAPLTEVARGHHPTLAERRFEAASVLADYAQDRSETLVDLLAEADQRQFALFFPQVRARVGETLALLRAEVERQPSWLRPLRRSERDVLASRQANAALALLLLGQPEAVWPLLRHSPDPTRRTLLALRLAAHGIEARELIDRLERTPDVSERRALLSALGEYNGEQVPPELRARLIPRLLDWYRDDPDPGLHGSIDWLLRQKMDGQRSRPLDWGQAEALAAIDAQRRGQPPAERRWSVNSKGMTFVHFPGPIEFAMGTPASEPDHMDLESLHRRRIERSFALANRKVTVRDFQAFRKAHPEVYHDYTKKYSPDPDCPITVITWYDAVEFCRWLSEEEGIPEEEMCYPSIAELEKCKKNSQAVLRLPADYLSRKGYRLPTEAEWEYACRAGTTTAHAYGNGGEDLLAIHAWYIKNADDRTWPVGQKRPNDFGLFDMHGNTWDWCQETARPYVVGPKGYITDEEDRKDVEDRIARCLRGGSYNYPATFLLSASRLYFRPSIRYISNGLRVARTL